MLDIFIDSTIDCVKLIPFLFLAYLFIEFTEHRAGEKSAAIVNRAGKLGPIAGAAVGVVPQCGFSALMSNLYAGGLITKGTLLASFLSTSDEMLPVLLSENVDIRFILKILLTKVVIALIAGLTADMLLSHLGQRTTRHIGELCSSSDCNCEDDSILRSALHHTAEVAIYIFIINLILNFAVEYIGEDALKRFVLNRPVIGELLCAIIGLIPNCASSVLITKLYIEGCIGVGAMISGLCVGSGVGLLVLFRVNHDIKDNLKTLAMLYVFGVIAGIICSVLPIF